MSRKLLIVEDKESSDRATALTGSSSQGRSERFRDHRAALTSIEITGRSDKFREHKAALTGFEVTGLL